MKLYNTRTRRVEPFEPQGNAVTLYVCGITPYDTTHLGHAFTYTTADILIRYLEFRGRTVRYVQNVTDIDDDILKKAKEVGDDWRQLGNRWTAHFIEDMISLNVRPPDYFPRATDVIPEIIESVQALIDAGVAYESAGNVYFHVDAWSEFGKLSQIPRVEMLPIANERGNQPDDPYKNDPLDFVLWQARAEGEPAWESPWGWGRPGWHIECSTMATRYLGQSIDIHGGGADLLFPHHECEIAQVEPVTDQPFVRTWLHAAMVHHEGDKMSKSLGNLVMVRDLLQAWSPDTLRIYLARHHYRQPWAYNAVELAQAQAVAQLIQEADRRPATDDTSASSVQARRPARHFTTFSASSEAAEGATGDHREAAFIEAMDNDLDTATALDVLAQLAQEIRQAGDEGRDIAPAQATLRRMAHVFGLRLDEAAETRVIEGWNEHLRRFDGQREVGGTRSLGEQPP